MCLCNPKVKAPWCGLGKCTREANPFADLTDRQKDDLINQAVGSRRPSLDDYFMGMARLVSTRSDWPGTHVGCVVVRDKSVISTGYNGTPRGWKTEMRKSEASKPFYCHAEENAIVQAAKLGHAIAGSTAYMTISPCAQCSRMMVNAGIVEVVYEAEWEHGVIPLQILNSCGVKIRKTER